MVRWTHCAISRSSQCSTTGIRKAVVCAMLSVQYKRMVHIKEPLLHIGNISQFGSSGFPLSLSESVCACACVRIFDITFIYMN